MGPGSEPDVPWEDKPTPTSDHDAIGFGSYQEAKAKGRKLGNAMADDVVAVLDKAIEEWFSEHTSMDRDSEWVAAYIRIVREEALLQLGGLVRSRAKR